MHKAEIEWRIAQVEHHIADCKNKAIALWEYPQSVQVHETLIVAAERNLKNLQDKLQEVR